MSSCVATIVALAVVLGPLDEARAQRGTQSRAAQSRSSRGSPERGAAATVRSASKSAGRPQPA